MSVTNSPSTPGTPGTRPGEAAYLGILDSLSRTPEQKARARNLGIGYFVAAAVAMWLGVKREDLIKSGPKDLDPNDPNAGAVV